MRGVGLVAGRVDGRDTGLVAGLLTGCMDGRVPGVMEDHLPPEYFFQPFRPCLYTVPSLPTYILLGLSMGRTEGLVPGFCVGRVSGFLTGDPIIAPGRFEIMFFLIIDAAAAL